MISIEEMVNSMTSDEYANMLDSFFGAIPDEINAMTDDEILAELEV